MKSGGRAGGCNIAGVRSSARQGPLERGARPAPEGSRISRPRSQAQPPHPAEHEQPWRRHMASWPPVFSSVKRGNGWGLETSALEALSAEANGSVKSVSCSFRPWSRHPDSFSLGGQAPWPSWPPGIRRPGSLWMMLLEQVSHPILPDFPIQDPFSPVNSRWEGCQRPCHHPR